MDAFTLPLRDYEQQDLVNRIVAARRDEALTAYPLTSRYPNASTYDPSVWGRIKSIVGRGYRTAEQMFPEMDIPIGPYPVKGKYLNTLAKGINSGIADIAGLPVDIPSMVYNLAATPFGAKPIINPIGGSESYRSLMPSAFDSPEEQARKSALESAQEEPNIPWGEQALFNVGRMGSMLAGGTALTKLPQLAKLPSTVRALIGEMPEDEILKAGVSTGLGMTGGEALADKYPDSRLAQFAPFLGALAGPIAIEPALYKAAYNPLANVSGQVAMSKNALSDVWQNKVGSKLMGLGSKIGDIPLAPLNSRFSRYMGGNTLNDWLLAPQERMRKSTSQLFRDTRSEVERLSEALRSSALQMKGLNLEDRESLREVMKYNFDISKASPGTQQKISDLLAPLEDAYTTTGAKLFKSAQRQAMVERSLSNQLLNLFAEDVSNPIWKLQKQAGAAKYDLSTEKGTKDFLDLILRDPSQDPKIKNLARDLYDIPAKTAGEVADAHRHALETLMASNIKKDSRLVMTPDELSLKLQAAHPGGLPDEAALKVMNKEAERFVEIVADPRQAGPGRMFVPGVGQEFKGLLVDRDVAEGLRDLDTHVSNLRRGWNRYFLQPWKFMKVGLNVPARLRDLYSNFMFNDIYGVAPLSPFRVDVYGSALNDLRNAAKGKAIPELERYFFHTGGKLDALNSVATDPIFSAMRHSANPLDEVLGWMYRNPIGHGTSELMKNVDLWSKYAKFKHNMASGKFASESDAIVDALRSTGNMLEQSRAVRNVRDTAMPFFGWTAHALKTIAHGMVNHPVRTLKWYLGPALAGMYGMDKLGMSEQEYADFKKTLPDYMQDSVLGMPKFIPLPYRDEKGKIQMMDISWWIPGLQDLTEMSQNMDNPVHMFQNPAFSIAAGLWGNKKFSGSPIWNEWDDGSTKWGKGLSHVIQQLVPPLFPGFGNQANKIWEAFQGENPDALTIPQALGTQIGARITPIDQEVQWQKNQARLQSWMNEAKHQMREELGRTQNPAKQEEVQKEYEKIIEKLMEEQQGMR